MLESVIRCLLAAASMLASTLVLPAPTPAQGGVGDLTLTPTRAVFEGRTRTAQLSLINRGSQTAIYRISFARLRMTYNGQLEEITEPLPEEKFADSLIRYSPRQVTLEPGVAQTVRLMLRKPAELPPGEYRSHLLLHAVPPDNFGDSIEAVEIESEELGIRLIPIYRISVPVIVRHGELEADAELSELAFEPADEEGPSVLTLRLERRGERSLYGDLEVTHLPADGGTHAVVGQIKGLAVYTPNNSRRVVMALSFTDSVRLDGGHLRIDFSEAGDHPRPAEAVGELPLLKR